MAAMTLGRRRAFKRAIAGEHLIEHQTERKDVAAQDPASCPVTCSGDMYWNVPSISPLPVSAMVMVPSAALIAGPGIPNFASPKSDGSTPALVTRIFAGFDADE